MSAAVARAALAELTTTLLDPSTEPLAQRDAARGLYELCGQLAGEPLSQATLSLPHGIALAPAWAARCLLDFARTARFLQGVRAAIERALERFGAPVEVLYAGCGPFAPLCLPLTTQLAPGSARFTLLEVQPAAAESAQRLAAVFGAAAWIERIETADALAWRAPRAPHVIVLEAMQKALAREPQVALTRHLAPQLAPGGCFVPEEVRLGACLSDLAREFDPAGRARLELGVPLLLRAEQCRHAPPALGPLRLTVPDHEGAGRSLLVSTRVRVFGVLELGDYDSGISYPTLLHPPSDLRPGTRVEFHYDDGAEPGLRFRILD